MHGNRMVPSGVVCNFFCHYIDFSRVCADFKFLGTEILQVWYRNTRLVKLSLMVLLKLSLEQYLKKSEIKDSTKFLKIYL